MTSRLRGALGERARGERGRVRYSLAVLVREGGSEAFRVDAPRLYSCALRTCATADSAQARWGGPAPQTRSMLRLRGSSAHPQLPLACRAAQLLLGTGARVPQASSRGCPAVEGSIYRGRASGHGAAPGGTRLWAPRGSPVASRRTHTTHVAGRPGGQRTAARRAVHTPLQRRSLLQSLPDLRRARQDAVLRRARRDGGAEGPTGRLLVGKQRLRAATSGM